LHWLVLAIFNNTLEYIFKVDIKSPLGWYAVMLNLLVLIVTIYIAKFTYIHLDKKYSFY